MGSVGKRKRILILIEDGSFLYDNRVRREAASLSGAGYEVIVVCPRYPGESKYDRYDKIHVYRYRKWEFGGHFGEYASSILKGAWLAAKIWRRHGRFDCIQACNPPDLWFLVVLPFKVLGRVKFVFDHHDLCPELLLSRFKVGRGSIAHRVMLLLERLTFALSDGVISTNESYKRVAVLRGGMAEEKVTVVRNGPEIDKFPLMDPDPSIRTKERVVVGYLGNMNPQDGVEHLLMAARKIVHELKRKDLYFVLIGKGDSYEGLLKKKTEWALDDHVLFTGRIPSDDVLRLLSSCDIGVQPDPRNPLNEVSTMNKVMEYMALAKPVVSYDLIETRCSCGDCGLYAEPSNIDDLASKILMLADDEEMRKELGLRGRKRVEQVLDWKYSAKNLVQFYRNLFSG
jgi:glycosyltransferase involved in cell wall biosynthesis